MNANVLSKKEKNTYIENQRSMKMDTLIFIKGVEMVRPKEISKLKPKPEQERKVFKPRNHPKMEFNKKYDYMFKQMIANLPVTEMAWLRPDFKKWWKRLGKAVDSEKTTNQE